MRDDAPTPHSRRVINLPYGKSFVELEIDGRDLLAVLTPAELIAGGCAKPRSGHAFEAGCGGGDMSIDAGGAHEVRRALRSPVGAKRLFEIAKVGEKVAIVTSDITRPMPSKTVLPEVLEELCLAGVRPKDITIIFALGIHRGHTPAEMRELAGDEVYEKYVCVDSDPCDFVHLGYTKRGTPVDIFRLVADADRRVLLGNIEYHYFAGYSGGLKAIMPGVSTRAAIQNNHALMTGGSSRAGALAGNPVRDDIDEVVNFISADYVVNVVLDEGKRIVKAFAGDAIKAHRAGCAFLDGLYKVQLPEYADIVVVSAGGYPKDIDMYQAQKALDNAGLAIKEGGAVILVAECPGGMGEPAFERWVSEAASPQSLIDRLQKRFELGGHKAAAIAKILNKARVLLVSALHGDAAKALFMEPYSTVNDAYSAARGLLGPKAGVVVMPYGGSTLPFK